MATMPDLDAIYIGFLQKLYPDEAPPTWAMLYGERVKSYAEKWGEDAAIDFVIDAAGIADLTVNLASLSLSFNPATQALKPVTAAISVTRAAFELESLYALNERGYANKFRDKVNGYRLGDYPCTCTRTPKKITVAKSPYQGTERCKEFIDFFKEQKDASVANTAISMTLVGLLYTGPRFLYDWAADAPNAEREKYAKMLAARARPVIARNSRGRLVIESAGCRQAQAIIALLLEDLDLAKPATEAKAYRKTYRGVFDEEKGWSLIADKSW